MIVCAVKRGFFNLRDCGALATGACATCARPICQEHTAPQGAAALCLDCYAREAEAAAAPQAYDSRWAYATRHHYYSTGSYSPFYWGSSYDHYYDDYDCRSFDREAADPLIVEEQGSIGVFDS